MGFVGQAVALAEELVVPGGAFFGLDAVLVADLHQQFALVEQAGQLAAQRAGALGQVFHQQVGQRIDGGADADFVIAAGEFVDQEHQATGTPIRRLVVGAL
jgi:hypothetical protein